MNQFSASLWGDEAWAATLAIKPAIEIITKVARDTSPPFYYLLLHFWMRIFGTSELTIRSLSFLFFLGTGLTVFLIGKQLWDKKSGVLAALLTLTNPFLFQYAFEGRMYALLALTSTLSVYFFLKKRRLGFILATTAALYTHHFSIFVIVWEGIWRLSETKIWRQPIGKTLKALMDFFIIILLYLPWLYPLYYQTSLVGSGFWLGRPNLVNLADLIKKFLVGNNQGVTQKLVIILIIIIFSLRLWIKEKNKTLFLLGWFLCPLFFTFIISLFFQPIFYDRYLLASIPGLLLILASNRRKASLFLIFLTVFLLATLNYQYFIHPTKQPFRQLADFIKKEVPNLTLINHNGTAHHLWETKYYGLRAPIYSPQPLPFYTGTALMEKGDVISELPKENYLGVITTAPTKEVDFPGYHQIKKQSFNQISFIWMEKD